MAANEIPLLTEAVQVIDIFPPSKYQVTPCKSLPGFLTLVWIGFKAKQVLVSTVYSGRKVTFTEFDPPSPDSLRSYRASRLSSGSDLKQSSLL